MKAASMKTASQYRAAAREALTGKYGFLILAVLIVQAITNIFAMPLSYLSMFKDYLQEDVFFILLAVFSLIAVIASIVLLPLQMGFDNIFLSLFRREDANPIGEMFRRGYRVPGKAIVAGVLITLILLGQIVPTFGIIVLLGWGIGYLTSYTEAALIIAICVSTLLYLVVAFIFNYIYRFTYFIMRDEPELSAIECLRRSRELTKGYKGRLFLLDLSFIGWYLLCILTLGVLSLWIAPYNRTAVAAFYEDRITPKSMATPVNTPVESIE